MAGSRPGPLAPRAHRNRLAQAFGQVGETDVRPVVARLLASAFLLAIAAPAALEVGAGTNGAFGSRFRPAPGSEPPSGSGGIAAAIAGNRALLGTIADVEQRLENETVLVELLRPGLQQGFTLLLRASTPQVYPGREGWLFYGPDVDYVTAPGFLDAGRLAARAAAGDTLADAPVPDPRPAILDLHRQLAARGIALIVMPTPVKPTVHPDRLRGVAPGTGRIENPSYDGFVRELTAQGVTVFEPGRVLARRENAVTPAPWYLATDTHWRPEAVRRVAAELAASIRRRTALPVVENTVRRRVPVSVSNVGDTLRLLDLPASQTRYRAETVTIRPVEVDGRPWRADRAADVLLLGDSFSNVYSAGAMGWGEGAGLAEQLSYALQRPVDRVSQNDDGAFASRARLAAGAARGDDRLAGKRVVVLQFAARELAFGDWRGIDVVGPDRRASPAGFIEPAPGARLRVRAGIRAMGPLPPSGPTPYRDHIAGLLLADLDPPPDADPDRRLVAYVRTRRDDEPTRAAGLRPGDVVELDLVPWAEVAAELDTISRGELADPDARLAAPWWGRFPEDAP